MTQQMPELDEARAMATERSCAVTAVALSGQRRTGARLVSGQHRGFGLSFPARRRARALSTAS
ncbi:hypothetical protein ATO49_05855 [Mycolicibacterium fortuitum subsp. fortuitum DSM 46621 = ATCC 6841 = JCM 6387]|nr:hypothetical protein ATO49_05855 [Mycolicibacterium fortuitum subsp. fortuitum DSM 46621 = ATCC 6841 = JCM 6387]